MAGNGRIRLPSDPQGVAKKFHATPIRPAGPADEQVQFQSDLIEPRQFPIGGVGD